MYTRAVHVTLTLCPDSRINFNRTHPSTSFFIDSMQNKTRKICSHGQLGQTLSVYHDHCYISSPWTNYTCCIIGENRYKPDEFRRLIWIVSCVAPLSPRTRKIVKSLKVKWNTSKSFGSCFKNVKGYRRWTKWWNSRLPPRMANYRNCHCSCQMFCYEISVFSGRESISVIARRIDLSQRDNDVF